MNKRKNPLHRPDFTNISRSLNLTQRYVRLTHSSFFTPFTLFPFFPAFITQTGQQKEEEEEKRLLVPAYYAGQDRIGVPVAKIIVV